MLRIVSKGAAAVVSMLLVTTANAGISGWGIRIGSVDVDVALKGVGNPATKPSITLVDVTLEEISYLCINPTDHMVAPGSAGQRTASGTDVTEPGDLVGKGQATSNVTFEFAGDDGVAPGAGIGPLSCVNPNWSYVPNSAAAELITISIKWHACTGNVKTDPTPCYDESNGINLIEEVPTDSVTGMCSIHPVLRNPDGSVVAGQVYDCVETSP